LAGGGSGEDVFEVGQVAGEFGETGVFEDVGSCAGGGDCCFAPEVFSYSSRSTEVDAGEPHMTGGIQPHNVNFWTGGEGTLGGFTQGKVCGLGVLSVCVLRGDLLSR